MRISLSVILAAAITTALLPAGATPAAFGPAWIAAPTAPAPAAGTSAVLSDVTMISTSDVWAVGAWWNATSHPFAVRWNGGTWTPTPVPDPKSQEVYSLAAVDGAAPNDVWAVGREESPDTEPSTTSVLLLHWDGVAWADVPGPLSFAGALADVDMNTVNDGWAVGQTAVGALAPKPLILRWKGGQWEQVAAPPIDGAARLTSITGSADDAWTVGTQTGANGRQASLVLHWDGVSWTKVAVPDTTTPDDEVLESVATTGGEVWAAGSRCATASLSSCGPLILRRSNGAWQAIPPATTHGVALTEIVPLSPNDVWVVGHARTTAAPETGHAEHWDGLQFTTDPTVASPPASGNGKPASAIALAGAASDKASGMVWAVGWSENPIAPLAIYRG